MWQTLSTQLNKETNESNKNGRRDTTKKRIDMMKKQRPTDRWAPRKRVQNRRNVVVFCINLKLLRSFVEKFNISVTYISLSYRWIEWCMRRKHFKIQAESAHTQNHHEAIRNIYIQQTEEKVTTKKKPKKSNSHVSSKICMLSSMFGSRKKIKRQ